MKSKMPKFKQTEIGEIPDDWEIRRISEFCDIRTGGTPSMNHSEYFCGNIKWIRSGDIHKKRIYDVEGRITTEGMNNSNAKLLPVNSVLIAMNGRGRTRASVAILKTEATCNQSLAAIITKDDTNPEYLMYHLENRYNELRNLTGDNDRSGLNLGLIGDLSVAIPRPSEQQKIAKILSTVDDAIQKSDEIIQKTQLLKKGLLHQLLTRGIGHSRFKQTEIGEIPEEWKVVKLAEIAEFKNGINFTKEQKGSRGVLTIDVLNMYGQSIYVDLSQLYRVNTDLKKEYFLVPGDILFVRSSLKREGVGWASLFGKWNEPVTFAGFVIRARLKRSDILPEFLTYFLRSGIARRELISSGGQVAITNISQDQLGLLDIPLPPLSEQQKIAEILSTVDKKIETETERKERLQKIKTGLMNDLLTGKRRVKVEA